MATSGTRPRPLEFISQGFRKRGKLRMSVSRPYWAFMRGLTLPYLTLHGVALDLWMEFVVGWCAGSLVGWLVGGLSWSRALVSAGGQARKMLRLSMARVAWVFRRLPWRGHDYRCRVWGFPSR